MHYSNQHVLLYPMQPDAGNCGLAQVGAPCLLLLLVPLWMPVMRGPPASCSCSLLKNPSPFTQKVECLMWKPLYLGAMASHPAVQQTAGIEQHRCINSVRRQRRAVGGYIPSRAVEHADFLLSWFLWLLGAWSGQQMPAAL